MEKRTTSEIGRGLDLRLVLPAGAAWLAAFAGTGVPPLPACVASVALLLAGTALLGVRRVGRLPRAYRLTACAVLFCAAAAGAGAGLRQYAVSTSPVRRLATAHAMTTLDVVITADPRRVRERAAARSQDGQVTRTETPGPSQQDGGTAQRGDLVVVAARAEAVRVQGRVVRVRVPVMLLARGERWRKLLPSQHVRLVARLTTPRQGGLLAAVGQVRGPPVSVGPPSSVQRAAARVRAGLREATSPLPRDQRGVLPGLVLGDTSQLDPRLEEQFRAAGLTHLMVVSGANLAIVIGFVSWLARFAGSGRRTSVALAMLAVPGFVLVARPDPSVLRATVMGLIGLLALYTGRERQGVPALAAAVLILVLADPGLARSYGFVLSVLATAGLLVIAPGWRDRLSERMPRPLAEALAMTAAAQAACAPVVVMLSGEVSIAGVPANLLAAPAVPPATVLGVVTAMVALVAMPVAQLIVVPAGIAVGWIAWIARCAASLPYATVSWWDGAAGGVLLACVVVLGLLCVRHRRLRRVTAAVLAGALAMAIPLRLFAPEWPPRDWLIVACDVGQGDMIVLSAGPKRAVVVDGGPDPALADRCLRELRIRTVALLVLTHPHADHIAGVPGVIRGRTVGPVVTSPGSTGQENRLLATTRQPSRSARPRPGSHEVPQGQRRSALGEFWSGLGSLTLTAIGPAASQPVWPGDDGSTVNNVSVVLLASWTQRPAGGTRQRAPVLTALLTGDVETEAQRELLERGAPAVRVLKVPHHGSARQDPEFLASSRAQVALISAGSGNRYGHPAPSLLGLLRGLGMRVYRTDRHGHIAVTRDANKLAVVSSRG